MKKSEKPRGYDDLLNKILAAGEKMVGWKGIDITTVKRNP